MQINFNGDIVDISAMLVSAERYALGRRTYIVEWTCNIIEHNLHLIKTCDHIIDLGPDGGVGGGTIVAAGTPEQVSKVKESYTGQWLKKYLER